MQILQISQSHTNLSRTNNIPSSKITENVLIHKQNIAEKTLGHIFINAYDSCEEKNKEIFVHIGHLITAVDFKHCTKNMEQNVVYDLIRPKGEVHPDIN